MDAASGWKKSVLAPTETPMAIRWSRRNVADIDARRLPSRGDVPGAPLSACW
jgi:hypothetical protein